MYYVYHIPNPNNPSELNDGYIGVSKNPEFRFKNGHNRKSSRLHETIKIHNISYDMVKIIDSFENPIDAYNMEFTLRSTAYIGWNLAPGGLNGENTVYSKELRKSISEFQSGKNNSMYGKKHTQESIEKMIKSSKGGKAWNKNIPRSKEDKIKMSISLMNKSEEWRKEMASKAGKASAEKTRGKKLSESVRNKISESHKNIPRIECPNCGAIVRDGGPFGKHFNSKRCKENSK